MSAKVVQEQRGPRTALTEVSIAASWSGSISASSSASQLQGDKHPLMGRVE